LQDATADEITQRKQQAEPPPQIERAILRISSPLNVVHNNRSIQPKRRVSILAPFTLLHPSMTDVYRLKVAQLAKALDCDDVELRESARSEIRALITTIVIPKGEAPLQLTGNLGEMLAIAAGGPDRSTLAAVAYSGCGGGINTQVQLINLRSKRIPVGRGSPQSTALPKLYCRGGR